MHRHRPFMGLKAAVTGSLRAAMRETPNCPPRRLFETSANTISSSSTLSPYAPSAHTPVVSTPSNSLASASSSTAGFLKLPQGRPPGSREENRRIITNLSLSHLTRQDQLDFGSMYKPRIHFLDKTGRTYQWADLAFKTEVRLRQPWPSESRGFLYYHEDSHLPLRGELRFRVSPDGNPAKGHDVLLPSGRPWSLVLLQIATVPKYSGLRNLLISNGLVSKSLVTKCQNLASKAGVGNRIAQCSFIHTLDDEFSGGFQQSSINLAVCSSGAVRKLQIRNFLRDSRSDITDYPYSGTAAFRFEPSTLIKDREKRVMHLRIVRSIEPIESRLPGYDGYIPSPKVGHLLQTAGGRLWAWDLDKSKTAHALELLWPAGTSKS